MASKSTLDGVLQAVLSTINKEANNDFPPSVFSNFFNIVTSFLLTELSSQYPKNQQVVDILDPFIATALIPATAGFIQLPVDTYRNLLGGPVIFANGNADGQCESKEPLTPENFATGILKNGCLLNPVIIKDQTEFAYLTDSTYNKPSYKRPIGYFSGKKQIRICPYDVKKVGIMYVINEPVFVYGYINNPDDTYIFDTTTSTESIWGSNAFSLLYKGVLALYGAYASDPNIINFTQILASANII